MSEFIVQVALSNLLISTVLAAVAYAVHRRGRYPMLAHLLWIAVLIKIVTPPLLHLPIVPALASATAATSQPLAGVAGASTAAASSMASVATTGGSIETVMAALGEVGLTLLLAIWALGSVLVLSVSLVRIVRFDRLLRRSSSLAPDGTQAIAAGVAWQLGLSSVPAIYSSRARLSPMTWWTGGAVRVVIPAALPYQLDPAQLRWVLAHELAHVKRRDHLVRWLEWLACVSFWWNPIVWFARRNLRLDEEISCDALVLDRLHGQPRSYARALLTVVEFLAGQTTRPPAMASGIDAGGSLERRFVAIVSDGRLGSAPRSLVVGLLGMAMLLMSVGVGFAGAAEMEVEEASGSPVAVANPSAAVSEAPGGPTPAGPETEAPVTERFALLGANVNVSAAIGGPLGSTFGSFGSRTWSSRFAGSSGADTYTGTRGRDRIAGKGGPDELSGRASRDLILGGRGADIIAGGAGADKLLGGPGDDTIRGNGGRDVIRAGKGSDIIKAGRGNDVVKTWHDGTADMVDCGAGDQDRAIIDSTDSSVNCEIVVVRDAT